MPMDLEEFWRLIEESREAARGDPVAQAKALAGKLAGYSPEDILEYEELFHDRLVESYHWALWGAAHVINGGCSDDAFEEFQAWLIGQGPEVFERVLGSPDSLAEILTDEHLEKGVLCEDLLFAGFHAYEAATGTRPPPGVYRTSLPLEPRGRSWDEDDLPRLLPKLSERFG